MIGVSMAANVLPAASIVNLGQAGGLDAVASLERAVLPELVRSLEAEAGATYEIDRSRAPEPSGSTDGTTSSEVVQRELGGDADAPGRATA
jgi:hypothetical protein